MYLSMLISIQYACYPVYLCVSLAGWSQPTLQYIREEDLVINNRVGRGYTDMVARPEPMENSLHQFTSLHPFQFPSIYNLSVSLLLLEDVLLLLHAQSRRQQQCYGAPRPPYPLYRQLPSTPPPYLSPPHPQTIIPVHTWTHVHGIAMSSCNYHDASLAMHYPQIELQFCMPRIVNVLLFWMHLCCCFRVHELRNATEYFFYNK